MTHDNVNSPAHYTNQPVECIEISGRLNFLMGNAVKYIWRFQNKNGLEDLQKARWYLQRQIESGAPLLAIPHDEQAEGLRKITQCGFDYDQSRAIYEVFSATPLKYTNKLDMALRHLDKLIESCHAA